MCKRIISIALLICVFLSAFTSCNNNKGGVDEIIFDKTELKLEVGEKTTIGVEIVPEELNRAVLKWQSSNPDVAKVIEGMVIGVAEGEAVISATSVNGKYAVCAVTVTLPEDKENDNTDEDDITDTKKFDYLTADLSKYVTIDKLTGFSLDVDIAKPHYDIDIANSKLNMLCEDKPKDAWIKGSEGAWYINPGDVVYIWYRGYVIVDGEEVWLDGMSNIADTYSGRHESYGLEIGSNGFIPGFELGLVGKKTTDFDDLEFIKEGTASQGTVAYISYTRSEYDSPKCDKYGNWIYDCDGNPVFERIPAKTVTSSSPERIDLSDESIVEKYGVGFAEKIESLDIGTKVSEFKTYIYGREVTYSNLIVNLATNNEDKGLLIEDIYFHYDYGGDKTLRNLDAKFYVYFDKIDRYYQETPVFDDEYIKEKIEDGNIAITLEEFNKYEGDTLVQKYDAYARELLGKIYRSELESMVTSAVWDHYLANARFYKNELPQSEIDDIYYDFAEYLYKQYETSGGLLGGYYQYDTFSEYANAFCGINFSSEYYAYGDEAWKYFIYDEAGKMVQEKILLFHILKATDSIPDDATFKARVEKIKKEYLDQYIEQWLDNKGESRDDYSDAEWEQFKKNRAQELLDYYGEEDFELRAYYDLLFEKMMEWVDCGDITIVTLDERHNYK